PVVPFIRHMSSDDHHGTSVAADILDLTDAQNKLMADAMVTSESYARPRRWATGLEIEEDEDGNPVDPFGRDRSLRSEDPDTKFGQFDPARLDSYADMSATITQMVGAMTGLPRTIWDCTGTSRQRPKVCGPLRRSSRRACTPSCGSSTSPGPG